MMEIDETKRRETYCYRIKEYIKLEGTSKSNFLLLTGLPKIKSYDYELDVP